MNAWWIALGFLSRIPAKTPDFNPLDAARSVFWFPAVGLLVGLAVALSAVVVLPYGGPSVAALFALAAWVMLTGALHLDGLADTFDGFSAASGGTDKARQAMKDSRIGAHGCAALVLALIGKWVLLARCAEINCLGPAVVLAATVSRLSVGVVLAWAQPAQQTGLGGVFAEQLQTKRGRVIPWLSSVWLVPVLTYPLFHAAVVRGWWTALGVSLVLVALLTWWLVRRFQRCFGGVSGDTHGATIELVELAVLTAQAAVFGRGIT